MLQAANRAAGLDSDSSSGVDDRHLLCSESSDSSDSEDDVRPPVKRAKISAKGKGKAKARAPSAAVRRQPSLNAPASPVAANRPALRTSPRRSAPVVPQALSVAAVKAAASSLAKADQQEVLVHMLGLCAAAVTIHVSNEYYMCNAYRLLLLLMPRGPLERQHDLIDRNSVLRCCSARVYSDWRATASRDWR